MNFESLKPRAGPPTNVRWIVLGMVAFASASAYLTRHCIAAANTTIQQDLGFDDAQMGKLMSVFALGYLLCQTPGGWLGNRFGTRLALALLGTLWSISNVFSAMASGYALMWGSRFFLGVFQAGLTPISAKILRDWIPLRERGLSSALITASMSVGGALTMSLTGWLLARAYDWRAVFACYSLVGIAWASIFYWFFRTFPDDHQGVNEAERVLIRQIERSSGDAPERAKSANVGVAQERTPQARSRSLASTMLGSLGLWGLCVQSFCRAAGYLFFVTWFFAFLEYVYGIDKAEAGLLNSLPLIAVVIGSISGGVLIDRLLQMTASKWISRVGVSIVALTASGAFTMASAWTSSAAQLSAVIAVGALFSGIGAPASWAATIDIGGRHTAIVMGIMNMAGCLAGVIVPTLLGNWFIQIRETGGDWDLVIYLHAGFYFVGALSWLAVNPNREIA